MTHSAKILADSVSPDGVRLTTLEVVFPRIVLAEFNTHRMLSRNSASSRAIPVEKMIRMVQEHPYVPTHWGKNQRGMQADQELNVLEQARAKEEWMLAHNAAVCAAQADSADVAEGMGWVVLKRTPLLMVCPKVRELEE